MAFKLNKAEIARRDGYVKDLREAADKVQGAIDTFNAALADLTDPVEQAIADYNEILAEANGFAEDIASQADSDFDSKSERWQEGDKGIEAAEFRDAWQQIELEAIEIALPGAVEFDAPEHADELEQLIDHAGEA